MSDSVCHFGKSSACFVIYTRSSRFCLIFSLVEYLYTYFAKNILMLKACQPAGAVAPWPLPPAGVHAVGTCARPCSPSIAGPPPTPLWRGGWQQGSQASCSRRAAAAHVGVGPRATSPAPRVQQVAALHARADDGGAGVSSAVGQSGCGLQLHV